ILTAVLWGWALVTMIDRRFLMTAAVLAVASLATLVGLVHSPLPGGALFWPWAEGAPRALALPLAGAYGALAALCAAASLQRRSDRSADARERVGGRRVPHEHRQPPRQKGAQGRHRAA